jgi:hypothetical protein
MLATTGTSGWLRLGLCLRLGWDMNANNTTDRRDWHGLGSLDTINTTESRDLGSEWC